MSVEYNEDIEELTITCDDCEEQEQFHGSSFQQCINEAKANGWVLHKDERGQWLHFCNKACKEFYIDDRGGFI